MKKTSFLLFLGGLAVLIVVLLGGYSFWQKSTAQNDLEASKKELAKVQNEFLQYENGVVEQAIAAKQTLNEISNTIIKWSAIIKEVRKTVPDDSRGRQLVEILSYSGSGDNEITLSMKTNSDSKDAYEDAADLIQAFDESNHFTDTFVPSVSKSKDVEGGEILTFMLSTKYMEEDVEVELEDSFDEVLGDVLNESLELDEAEVEFVETEPSEEEAAPVTR